MTGTPYPSCHADHSGGHPDTLVYLDFLFLCDGFTSNRTWDARLGDLYHWYVFSDSPTRQNIPRKHCDITTLSSPLIKRSRMQAGRV
jgi:hypothetical protein